MNKLYSVIADHAEFSETFATYREAYAWLLLVRGVMGSNAGIIETEKGIN